MDNEVIREMMEDMSICFIMSAYPIPNAKEYEDSAKAFQIVLRIFLFKEYNKKLLQECLGECIF